MSEEEIKEASAEEQAPQEAVTETPTAEAPAEPVKEVLNGKIKWFSNVKGFGFIERDGEQDIFVHYSSIVSDGYKRLKGGEAVTFEIKQTDKGPQAANVVKQEKEVKK